LPQGRSRDFNRIPFSPKSDWTVSFGFLSFLFLLFCSFWIQTNCCERRLSGGRGVPGGVTGRRRTAKPRHRKRLLLLPPPPPAPTSLLLHLLLPLYRCRKAAARGRRGEGGLVPPPRAPNLAPLSLSLSKTGSLSAVLYCFVAFSRGSEGSYPRAKGRLIHDQAMLAGNPPPLRSTRVRLARAFATTTKIRTSGGSRPARAVSFYAHHRALLLAGASRPPRRSP